MSDREAVSAQHTLTPWRVGLSGSVVSDSAQGLPVNGGFRDVEYYGGNLIAESVVNPANAALIVRAVNAHAALVGIVAALSDIMSESHGVSGWHLNGEDAPWSEFADFYDIDATLALARDPEAPDTEEAR